LGVYQKNFYTRFVDLEKAYGRVLRDKLWGVLREYDVDDHLLLAVKAVYLVLLSSSQQGPAYALDLKISRQKNKKYRGITSLYKPKAVYAASERNTLQQVEKSKYIDVVFTSDGRLSDEAHGWIAKVNAVFHELYRSVVTNRELSNTANLSVIKSFFVLILTNDPESWVMTEIILSQRQVAKMAFCEESIV